MNDLFVIPKIRIIARIQVIFEIVGIDVDAVGDAVTVEVEAQDGSVE